MKKKRGRPRINPVSPEQWQEAVNQAYFGLCIDSLFQYGLLESGTGQSGIKVDRCVRILTLGKKLGYEPKKEDDEQPV